MTEEEFMAAAAAASAEAETGDGEAETGDGEAETGDGEAETEDGEAETEDGEAENEDDMAANDDDEEEECDKVDSTPDYCVADADGMVKCDPSATAAGTDLPKECELNADAIVTCEAGTDVSAWDCELDDDNVVKCVEDSRMMVRSIPHCDLNADMNVHCKIPEKEEGEGAVVDNTVTNTDGATSVTTFAAALVAAVYALVF